MDNAPVPPAVEAALQTDAAPSAQDLSHLDTIGILYYVLAGFSALFALFPVIHLIVGIGMIVGGPPNPKDAQQVALIGWLFVSVAIVLIAFGMTLAVLFAMLAGRLRQRRGYRFCMVVSALSCLSMPFGTILGVFSLILLAKLPIKALFGAATPGSSQPGSSQLGSAAAPAP